MAGIVGQLTVNARNRKNRKKFQSDKCMYNIQEFDRNGYDPMIHNRYVRNIAMVEVEKEMQDTVKLDEGEGQFEEPNIQNIEEDQVKVISL